MDPNARDNRVELGRVETGETIVRIYYGRKINLFSIKGKKKIKNIFKWEN